MGRRTYEKREVRTGWDGLGRKDESHARHQTLQYWRGSQRCGGVTAGERLADDGLRPQAAKALMFRRTVGPFLPQHAQDFDSPRGAIGPPIGGRVAYGRRLTLLARDYRRLGQRRRGRRARRQGEREGN